ncbi:hypothetical protein NQ314_014415 [Rhamnusium bicolor]|uniref:Apoptogenic protein 1, mitochondrial n=1 Tax=Rhamnusium bicolor TaxID=1586634 RepID=A0AAV8X2V5_9CUCU|nr:hypothetical protein NQ314_014415 [Rhamnusium bicolor]
MFFALGESCTFHKILYSNVRLSLLKRCYSSEVPETVLIGKGLEDPVIVINEDDNVDIIGPPDPVSNLRPVIRKRLINESALQQRLREMQDTTQEWNHSFWSKHNTKFIKERQEYIKLHLMKCDDKQQLTADEMSEFYKKFLDENWNTHVKYNFEWYKKNLILLIFALGVNIEKFVQKVS